MRRPSKNREGLIIIGGGASGLAAACIAAVAGAGTLLLEKEERVGRKLLATGNGRCNLLNFGEPAYFGDSAFAEAVLSACSVSEVAEFFMDLGLLIRQEEDGRAYPLAGQASGVLDCLRLKTEGSPYVRVRTGCTVSDFGQSDGGFAVRLQNGETFEAERLIVAAGGPAAPRLGGSGSLIKSLAAMGHRFSPFRPALSALVTDTAPIKGLSGQRVPAYLTLYGEGKPLSASAGELLFTDYGLSGVCAMQLSRDAGEGLETGREMTVSLDFSPLAGLGEPLMRRISLNELNEETSYQAMLALLREREGRLGRERLYAGMLPRLMAVKVQSLPLPEAARWLTGLRLRVTGVKGFDAAQVSAGGLLCADFDPLTLRSRLVPGLYAAGEMLDVDGDCGGFNLLFAWATGILAARDACRDMAGRNGNA